MSITHEKARTLIQFSLDEMLRSAEKTALSAHLQDCMDCRAYASEIKEVETFLVPLMKRQWNARPFPLSMDLLIRRKHIKSSLSSLLTTRTAVIGVVMMALFFSAWQFVVSGTPASTPSPAGVFPAPTPSTQRTSTRLFFDDCEMTFYAVRPNDTLASLAVRFSVSEEGLKIINNLQTETLSTGMELRIPICNSTPTGTVHPVTFTTTYTPILHPTISTPGPSG